MPTCRALLLVTALACGCFVWRAQAEETKPNAISVETVVPIVLEDLCASAAGPQYHEAGLFLLRRLIGNEQVRPA